MSGISYINALGAYSGGPTFNSDGSVRSGGANVDRTVHGPEELKAAAYIDYADRKGTETRPLWQTDIDDQLAWQNERDRAVAITGISVQQAKNWLAEAAKIANYSGDRGRGRNSYARQSIADAASARSGITKDMAQDLYGKDFYSGYTVKKQPSFDEQYSNPLLDYPDPRFGERAGRTVLGAVEGSVGDTVGAFANFYEGGIGGAAAQRERELADLRKQQERAAKAVEASIQKYNGDMDNANVQAAQRTLKDIEDQIKVYEGIDDSGLYDFANDTYYKAADAIKTKSQQNIERAKQGLGTVGQFAVDLGVAATQMGLDALTMKGLGMGGAKTGMKAAGGLMKYMRGAANVLPAMAVHSYGSGALQARAAGASYERQALFGLATAIKEVMTEKIGDMPKLAGGGLTDKIVNRALSKFIDSPVARTAVRAVIGFGDEAFEEFIGGIVEPALESIYNDKSIRENYSDMEISDILYDALVGGVLGAIGTGRASINGSFAADDARIRIQNEAQANIAKQLPTEKSSSTRAKAEAVAKALSGEELTRAEQAQLDRSPVAQSVLAEMQKQGVDNANPLYNTQAKRQDEKLADAAAKATDSDFAAYSDGDLIKIARAAKTAKDDALYQRVISEFERRAAEREAMNAPEQRIDTTEDQAELAARLNPQLREQGDRNERPVPMETSQYDENGNPIPDYYQPERAPFNDEDVPPEFGNMLPDDQRELMQRGTNQPPTSQTQQPAPQPAPATQPAQLEIAKGQVEQEQNKTIDSRETIEEIQKRRAETNGFRRAYSGLSGLGTLADRILAGGDSFREAISNIADRIVNEEDVFNYEISRFDGAYIPRRKIDLDIRDIREIIEATGNQAKIDYANKAFDKAFRQRHDAIHKPIRNAEVKFSELLDSINADSVLYVGDNEAGYFELAPSGRHLRFVPRLGSASGNSASIEIGYDGHNRLYEHEGNLEEIKKFIGLLERGASLSPAHSTESQANGTIGASNTEEANNGREQTVQQPVAGAGGDAGAVGGQTFGRNADVSGGRSDSALQERGAGFGSPETHAGAGEGTGGNGSSFLSVSKAKNGADLEGDVISERDYDKDQREFSKTAYEDGFESTTIVDGDSFVIDGIEANGHVDSNGNLTVANLDPEKRRCVKDHECIHLWSHAIPNTERVNTLKAILLNIADRNTLNSMWTAYSNSLRDTYSNLKGDAYKAKVFEEILGDMYGGINRFETNASYYRAAAQSAVKNAKMRQNYLNSTRNNAIKKAWDGDTKYLKTRDLKSALSYTLDRLSPETKTKPTAERAADIMLAYYDESSDGTLNGMSKEQTKHAIAVMRNLLNELGARKVSLSDFTGSTTGYEDTFGLVQDSAPAKSFEGKNGNVFTRKQKNEFIDLSQEPESDSGGTEGGKVKKTPLQADEEYLRGDYQRDIEALRKTSEWEAGGRQGKMPKGANYLEGTVPVSFDKQQGWFERKMPSTTDIDEAKKILEAKGKRATIKDQINVLKARKDYLIEIGKSMKAIRSDFYGSGDIEQRKADLGYIADGVKEQLNQLESDLGYVLDEYDLGSVGESLAGIQDILNQSDRLNVLLDAMRDEYRHLKDGDSDALRTIRSQIDAVNVEIKSLSRQLDRTVESSDDLFKSAEREDELAERAEKDYERTGDDKDSFWRDEYKQKAQEYRHRGQKRKNRENWAKRTLAQAESFEERQPSDTQFFAKEAENLEPASHPELDKVMKAKELERRAKSESDRKNQRSDFAPRSELDSLLEDARLLRDTWENAASDLPSNRSKQLKGQLDMILDDLRNVEFGDSATLAYLGNMYDSLVKEIEQDRASRIEQSSTALRNQYPASTAQQNKINAQNMQSAAKEEAINSKLAAQIREDLGLPPKSTPQRRAASRRGDIGVLMSADAFRNSPAGKELYNLRPTTSVSRFKKPGRGSAVESAENFDSDEGYNYAFEMRQGYADRYTDDSGNVSVQKRGMKDPSGFRTSRSEGSFSTADVTFGKEASEFRKKLDNIVNGKGELFKAVTEADNAPLHDDLDNPKAKLTKEQREKATQRVGSKPTVKPVTQEVADAMLHLQEDVKGILESNAPLRHVLNLTESIRSYGEESHEMNWLTKNGIAEAAQELQDIFDDKNMDNDVKARNMAEATTRLLQMVSTRVDRVEANRARGLSLEQSISENARQQKEPKTKLSKFGQKAKNWAESMQLNPTTAFKMADGFDKQKNGAGYWIARQIENAVAKEQMLTASVHGKYNALKGVEGVDDFVSGKSMAAVEVPGIGRITEQQAVEFIKAVRTLYEQKVGNDRRLDTIKGFTFIDKNGKEATVDRKSLKSSDMSSFVEDVRRIETEMAQKLSPAAKKYLEITDEILDDLGTQVSSAMQRTLGVGMTQYHKGGYYPVKYQSQGGKKAPVSSKPAGLFDQFTERTKTTGGLIRIESAADTVDSYIRNAVYAASYGELADTLEFLNTPALGLDGLSNAAGEAFGSDFKRMFNNYVRDVAGVKAEDVTGDSALLHSARQLLQQGALRFSISVPIKQVASYWNAAGVVSPEALMQAYRFKLFKDKGYGKNNLQLQYRAVGGIDPTLSEMLNNQGFLTELKKRSGIINAWDKAISTMDYRTVDDLYHACIIDAKSVFPSVDQNSKQFADIVNSLFQEAVLSTQPTFNANARSEYQRTSNEWIRMAGMFRTQQTQNFNRAVTALGEYNAAKGTILEASAKKQLRQTLTGQLAAAAEFGLLSIVAEMARHKLKPYKKDEDEQTEGNNLSLKKIGTRLALNTLESLAGNLWIGLGGADQLVKGMVDAIMHDTSDESGEYRGINLGPITSAANAFKNLQSVISTVVKAWEEKDLRQLDINALRYAATNTAQLFGIPANNVVNFVDSALTYVLDGVSEITGEKKGNRADYDSVIKMVNKAMKGELTTEAAKHQANLAFNSGDAENLLYNIGILEAQGRIKAEKEGKDDPHSGADYLAGRLLGNTDEQKAATRATEVEQYGRELASKERIANYLVGDGLSDKQIDEAMDEYVTSGGYNVLYNALRERGFTPKQAVNELYKHDGKEGMSTKIRSNETIEGLLAGKYNPGQSNDVPKLEEDNVDEYVNYVTALNVFAKTDNYSEMDKMLTEFSKLDANTQAVIMAKSSDVVDGSSVKHLLECSSLGISSKDYYGLKETMKDVQWDLNKSATTGTPLRLIALQKANLTDSQREALLQSDWMAISKTGKTCIDVLSGYGFSLGDIGEFMNQASTVYGQYGGTGLTNVKAAAALEASTKLTPQQKVAVYDALKRELSNNYNKWYNYNYQSEVDYIHGAKFAQKLAEYQAANPDERDTDILDMFTEEEIQAQREQRK